MLLPIAWSAVSGDGGFSPLARSFAAGICVSAALGILGNNSSFKEMSVREAILSVAAAWIVASVIIGLPYIFGGITPNFLDSFFEGASGFTTTGATVIRNLGEVPRSILLWRNFSQWIGGVGIVVLTLAMTPASGAGSDLYKAEVADPIQERLTPRIQETAAFLCKTYLCLTCTQITLLSLGGLDIFDSLTLSFGTTATGGFSPYPDNVGHFAGSYVKWITAIFLFLSAANLTFFHSLIVRRSFSPLKENPEFRYYVATLLIFGTLVSVLLYSGEIFPSLEASMLQGFFHTVSMLSTCGFFIADYTAWPASVRFIMLTLMICGGCAISTAGGITCARMMVIMRHIRLEFVRLLHPRAQIPTRAGVQVFKPEVISSCFAFFAAYIGVLCLGLLFTTASGLDFTSAISGVAATLGNVGPGFGMTGPAAGYASLSPTVKSVYIFLMLCGRLEIFTLLVIFTPAFWRR
jgi:trk system potassium uptake protein TrkH